MFTDLNMWDHATRMAEETNTDYGGILKKKAKILMDRNDLLAAATTYMEVGDFMQAIEILGPNNWLDKLIEVARKLNKSETKALSRCVHYFRNQNHHTYAAECLVKMGDIQHLLNLHIDLQHWEDAFKLSEMHPEFVSQIHLPYANWLAMNDRFVEAQLNYRKAGRLDEAFRVLLQLTQNSISEKRYEDASYYFWMLSMQHLESLPSDVPAEALDKIQRKTLQKYRHYLELSEVYYAYHNVQRYMDEPFTSHLSESLFNMSRFILGYLNRRPHPSGISKVYVLYAFAKLSRVLGAFKAARHAYEKLQQCIIPGDWVDSVELGSLTVRSKPMVDRQELLSLCFGCGTLNPLISFDKQEDQCCHCSEPFIHSFYSFDTLPLVQFVLEPDITQEEAMKLLETPSPTSSTSPLQSKGRKDSSLKVPGHSSDAIGGLTGGIDSFSSMSNDDNPFDRSLMELNRGASGQEYSPILVNRKNLINMDKHQVYIRRYGKKCIPDQYFKQINPDVESQEVPLRLCSTCNHFFLEDEW